MKADILKIDVDAVLRERLPRHYRFIPRFLIRALERLVRQDELNRLLTANAGRRGSDFCRGVLAHLGVSYALTPGSALPDPADSRVIFVSNHPLGGLDGMALIDLMGSHFGIEPWFVVNDLLRAVEPLRTVFLPVNKHGKQGRRETADIAEALLSPRPLIMFHAGLVSRRGTKGVIADLRWQKKFLDLALKYNRPIIPLHFDGRNSDFFYKFAHWRECSGLKFNIEMALLPRELFLARGSTFSIAVGDPIPPDSPLLGLPRAEAAERIRQIVYNI